MHNAEKSGGHLIIVNIQTVIGNALKDNSKDINVQSQQFLIRAGYYRIFNGEIVQLPMGIRFKEVLLYALNAHAQQIVLPKTYSLEKFMKTEITSYRMLPLSMYFVDQIQEKNYTTNYGLLTPKNEEIISIVDLDVKYDYSTVLKGLNIPVHEIEGIDSREWVVSSDYGMSRAFYCECGYAATAESASAVFFSDLDDERKRELIETPNCTTIEEVAEFVGVDTSKTAKAVFYFNTKLIFVVIRGDLEVNEEKIKNYLGIEELLPATDEQILAIGANPGYASPIGINREQCTVLADITIERASNLVAGANRPGYHYLNTNYGRDYEADELFDLSQVRDGDTCRCGSILSKKRIISLAKQYELKKPINIIRSSGQPYPVPSTITQVKLLATVGMMAEYNHDDFGLIIPKILLPYPWLIITIIKTDEGRDLLQMTLEIFAQLGLQYLLDDRPVKPSIKFVEADLRGLPRLLISDRLSVEEKIEVKFRNASKILVHISDLHSLLYNEIDDAQKI
ncbi:MAG: hypothetical protein INQ03_02785 [Candidatus Heimdallarchaeota archaeon]|nr:hypothetical protein [Candidatus Heimdallarchaeota archaeon]